MLQLPKRGGGLLETGTVARVEFLIGELGLPNLKLQYHTNPSANPGTVWEQTALPLLARDADVLFAPGLPNLEAIRTVCASVGKPVNIVLGARNTPYTLDQLAAAGVRRVSTGSSFARAALTGLGWKPAIARAAVDAAAAAQGPEVTLERLIFESLRCCPAPRA